jgi:hypothetical protein
MGDNNERWCVMLGSKKVNHTTGNRTIERRIQSHIKLMTQFIGEGMSREDASKKAYDIVVAMKFSGRKNWKGGA